MEEEGGFFNTRCARCQGILKVPNTAQLNGEIIQLKNNKFKHSKCYK